MRFKLIAALVLSAGLIACGPATVKKYYFSSTATTPAPNVSVTLYNQEGQPIVVQPAPVNVTNNISTVVSTTVLYTADGKPITVQIINTPTGNGKD